MKRIAIIVAIASTVIGFMMVKAPAREEVQDHLQNTNSTLNAIEQLGLGTK